jgi:hypothetical protein
VEGEEMTQRVTIQGREYEIKDNTVYESLAGPWVALRKVEQPKESERLWEKYKSRPESHRMEVFASLDLADFIIAKVKEELGK